MKKILTVSLFAMMAVSAANADIASTKYVNDIALTKEDVANRLETIPTDTNELTNAQYPSAKAMVSYVADELSTMQGGLGDELDTKVNIAQGSTNVNKAVITNASGNITTGEITSGMITDKTIVNADISDTAEIAQSKISGLTTALSGKQATIADLTTIRSGAAAGATALQKADIDTGANNGTIKVGDKNVAVKGLGSAAYTASSTYAAVAQGSENANKAVITDASGNIKTGTITSGMITDKTIVNADISDTAEIAQSKISGLTTALSGKQATIADLTTIRSGAAAGATALQKADIDTGANNGTIKVGDKNVAVKGLGSAAYTASSTYAAVAQGSENANKAVITDASGNIKTGTITSGMITDKTIVNADISDTAEIAQSKISGLTTALSGKQATIADLTTIRSGAAAGATALQEADIGTGANNGEIKVGDKNVAVKGLGTAAYTASSAYATSAQGTKADNAVAKTDIGVGANFTIPDECKAENAVCSLVVRKGVAGWEKVTY